MTLFAVSDCVPATIVTGKISPVITEGVCTALMLPVIIAARQRKLRLCPDDLCTDVEAA